MTLSKKNFQKTAQILHDTKASPDTVLSFANYFGEENPRFDRERFIDAVRTGSDKRKVKRL